MLLTIVLDSLNEKSKEDGKMKLSRMAIVVICIAAFMAAFTSPVMATEADKLTIFTFSQPVELPGVTLPAGTYTFKLLDSTGPRNVVQVFNKDRTKLYATILTIPDYRPQASEKTIIKFSETAAGGPPAIKEWFYPGDLSGQEFVYPKNRAVQLAKDSNQSVPSMPQNLTPSITQPAKTSDDASVTAMKNSEVKSEEPNGGEVEIATAFITVQPVVREAGVNTIHNINTDAEETSARALPRTASSLPALGLLGTGLIMSGLLLWGISKRTA
jgi:hypothetical protein